MTPTSDERRIADELHKAFGDFKRMVIDVDGNEISFSADSLIRLLEGYEGFASAEGFFVDVDDETLASHGLMRLPVDADGEVIHIGDVMDTEHFGTVEVEGFVHSAVAFYNYSGQPAYICTAPANTCHHHVKPTVEDVLRQFAHVGIRIAAKHGIEAGEIDFYADEEAIAEFAAKLRLAGDAETCRQEEWGWTTEGDHARVFLTCGHNCMVETVADLPNFCPVCGARVEAVLRGDAE